MAGRGRTTFQKRQKEQVRLERRQQKAARRIERKAVKDAAPAGDGLQLEEVAPDTAEQPAADTTEQPAPDAE
jgi:hypothetical protein